MSIPNAKLQTPRSGSRKPETASRRPEVGSLSLFPLLLLIAMGMFAYAPFMILNAPYEATMGLVQKIFYFHVGAAIAMFVAAFTCGIASAIFLFGRRPGADRVAFAAAEITVMLGLIVLISGPLWARKAWGVWWQWDARLTSTLVMWLVFQSYLLLRRFGGPGSEKLSAAVGLFGSALVPFVYWSVNLWRTVHPTTNVVPTLAPSMRGPFLWCVLAFLFLFVLLMTLRVELEKRRTRLDDLYLALED
ncbi:MAG TPA: cytochrome c biogenesis protein CcsA [Vicinamibacterales bacterium]|nr:cytochrome c biogenesis protein CcsA [Vicinamibacterales bacterium]